ncbi:MAG: hypothetical protein JWO38_7003 [Gemmataceae bacterium]|nr:hypothetical protein [Gemmataceae bacterium]
MGRAAAGVAGTATGQQGRVYNLILKAPGLFVAGGVLARSKPPAPSGGPTTVEPGRPV